MTLQDINGNPVKIWETPNTWAYSITNMRAEDYPCTHKANAEFVDSLGNYHGWGLGCFCSLEAAERAIRRHHEKEVQTN